MSRRLLSMILLLASGALIATGGWLLLSEGKESSGDVAGVESALRSDDALLPSLVQTSTTTTTTTTTTTPPVEDEDSPPVPVVLPQPTGLRIDALGVDAPVAAYGVDQSTGQMAVPDNVTDVAWYQFGPTPGESGSAVLAAHVDLAGSGPGVFFDLDTLEAGDRVVVMYEDGSESPFRVVARTNYEKEDLPLDVVFSREGPSVLTLITCGGGFNRNIARYDSNVVVYAVPYLGSDVAEGSTL